MMKNTSALPQRPTALDEQGRRRSTHHRSMPASALKGAAEHVAADFASQQERRPSIPTNIMPDICEECGDDSSVVSEMTNMTYSAEKVKMVMEEFFRRMKSAEKANGDRNLTREEKESLLDDIQLEQDWKFKRQQMKEREEEREKERLWRHRLDDGLSKSGIFERLASSLRRQTAREDHGGMRMSAPPRMNQCHSLKSRSEDQELEEDLFPTLRNEGGPREARGVHREIQHGPLQQVLEPLEPASGPEKPGFCKTHIDEIIELKMLVANQQATIDTLSANLHNLRLELARPTHTEDQSQAEALEVENRHLVSQLNQCLEQEASWRMEANSQHQLLIESDAEQLELEKENLNLMRENSELSRRLMELQRQCRLDGNGRLRNSNSTDVTEASTVADSVAHSL